MPRRRDIEEYDHLGKLLLLGDSAVGKSSLLMRFVENRFDASFVLTIGVDFKTKLVESGRKKLKLQIWDTAGQERFRTITPAYFRSAMGVILVYDIASAETFNNVHFWMKNLEDYAESGVLKILIGNKSDLDHRRQVPTQRGRDLAAEFKMPFFETSAKLNTNVETAFMAIANMVRYIRFPSPDDDPSELTAAVMAAVSHNPLSSGSSSTAASGTGVTSRRMLLSSSASSSDHGQKVGRPQPLVIGTDESDIFGGIRGGGVKVDGSDPKKLQRKCCSAA